MDYGVGSVREHDPWRGMNPVIQLRYKNRMYFN